MKDKNIISWTKLDLIIDKINNIDHMLVSHIQPSSILLGQMQLNGRTIDWLNLHCMKQKGRRM